MSQQIGLFGAALTYKKQGIAALQAGDFDTAYDRFTEARAIDPYLSDLQSLQNINFELWVEMQQLNMKLFQQYLDKLAVRTR